MIKGIMNSIKNSFGSNNCQINGSSSTTINGKTYKGNNISINGNKVTIDGVLQTDELGTTITVVVQGNCESIESSSGDITVEGSCRDINTASGDVKVLGDVNGDISTMSGDVDIKGSHSGKIKTMSGDVSYR